MNILNICIMFYLSTYLYISPGTPCTNNFECDFVNSTVETRTCSSSTYDCLLSSSPPLRSFSCLLSIFLSSLPHPYIFLSSLPHLSLSRCYGIGQNGACTDEYSCLSPYFCGLNSTCTATTGLVCLSQCFFLSQCLFLFVFVFYFILF